MSQRHDNQIFMSASTGRNVVGNVRVFGSDTPLTCRSMYVNASLTLFVSQRYLPSSTRSPPVASPKSYHSFSRSLTLNDGVTSFLRGERYQYCSDFIYCARWPSWAKSPRYALVLLHLWSYSISFHLFAQKRFSLVCNPIYINTKLN